MDGVVLAETKPVSPNSAGHEEVPVVAPPEDSRCRQIAPGDQERIVAWKSDGESHRVALWALIGEKRLRPETGELSACLIAPGDVPRLIGGPRAFALTDESWIAFDESERRRIDDLDAVRRREAARTEDPYWKARHDLARREAEKQPPAVPAGEGN